MPTNEQFRKYASDPVAFIADLTIPGARGAVRFGKAMPAFQRDEFKALAPALLAVANGQKPPIGRYWWERTKGASKDSDLACALLWLLAFTRKPLLCQVGAADQDQADELRKAAKDVLRLNPWLGQRIEIQRSQILCGGTSSVVDIIAADTAGSHGARPDVLILNELSHVTKQEFAENLMDNAAMDENPYRSPSAETRIDDEPLLPFWRRVISLVLIIFGLMYGLSGFAMLVGFVIWPERRQDVLQSAAAFGLGLAMLWGGLRLRRRKPARLD
jgi:Phage Terminase